MIRTFAAALLSLSLSQVALAASAKDEVSKPLKTIVGAIRQSRDLAALRLFASDEQGEFLVGADWAKGTEAQRKAFSDLFLQLFGKLAFPKIRDSFKNLDAVLYEEPSVNGDRAEISSVILINHPLKKQELTLKYALVKREGAWRVVDVTVLGDSMLLGIRDDQVRPIFAEGGWDKLLRLMREKNDELKAVVLK